MNLEQQTKERKAKELYYKHVDSCNIHPNRMPIWEELCETTRNEFRWKARSSMQAPRMYLDLDGVMADFDLAFYSLFRKDPHDVDDKELWRLINTVPTFFRDLPLMTGALEFWKWAQPLFRISILTACPRSNYQEAARQKIAWCRQHLGNDVTILPVMGGKNKVLFMHSAGDILIDDFEKNILPWREHGGVGIIHRNFPETKEQLHKVMFF